MEEYNKEKSPQLQIHDPIRGIALLRHKTSESAALNYIKVKQEPAGGSEERLLTCLKYGNDKIQLLLVIPQLCSRIIHGNPELESILGSECTEALYQLFLNQFTWIESKRGLLDEKRLKFPFRQTPSKPINETGSDVRTKRSQMGKLRRRSGRGKAGQNNDIPGSATQPLTETELDGDLREFLRQANEPQLSRLMQLVDTQRHYGEIDEEPSPDGISMSAHFQPQTHLVTLIKGALGNDKYGDHVRKCVRDKDHQALLSTLAILNQEGKEIPQTVNEPTCNEPPLGSMKALDDEEAQSQYSDSDSSESVLESSSSPMPSGEMKTSVCEEASRNEEVAETLSMPVEENSASDLELDPHFTNKSLESFYIDQLFQASSSEYTGSNGNSTVSSSETDKRNMDFEIQAVLEQNASRSASSESPTDRPSVGEMNLVSAMKDISIDNGSGTSMGLEKDLPIFVEVSRKIDVEPTSSETTSQVSSLNTSSSQATTASGISSISEPCTGINDERAVPDVQKPDDNKIQNLDELKKHNVSNIRNRMKPSIDERIESAQVAATAFGVDVNEYLLQEIQSSYARVLRLLVRNTIALQWIQTVFKLDAKDYLARIIEDPPMGCTKGLVSVYKYMTGLHTLARERLLTSSDEEMQRLRRLRYFWTREKHHLQKLEKLKISMKELEDEWAPRIQKLDRILDSCIEKIKTNDLASHEDLRNITRQGVTTSIIQEKSHEITMNDVQLKHSKTEATAAQYHQSSINKERNWKIRKDGLEAELEKLIENYDRNMTQAQGHLDELEKQDSANMGMIMQLQKDVEDTDERFEEMRITKKLKELLRNMEMADGFKRNRAARVIQDAWRRYKMRKLRKMRRKEKVKRKPKIPRSKSRTAKRNTDDTLSEVSCATSRYSTPAFKKERPSIESKAVNGGIETKTVHLKDKKSESQKPTSKASTVAGSKVKKK